MDTHCCETDTRYRYKVSSPARASVLLRSARETASDPPPPERLPAKQYPMPDGCRVHPAPSRQTVTPAHPAGTSESPAPCRPAPHHAHPTSQMSPRDSSRTQTPPPVCTAAPLRTTAPPRQDT